MACVFALKTIEPTLLGREWAQVAKGRLKACLATIGSPHKVALSLLVS